MSLLRSTVGVVVLTLIALVLPPVAAGPTSETKTLEPGHFVEWNLNLTAGQNVTWTLTNSPADNRTTWEIHTHERNGSVREFEVGINNGTQSSFFLAPRDGTFSWGSMNPFYRYSLQVTFTYEVGAASRPAPGLPSALVLAAPLAAALLARRLRSARP